MRGDRAGWLWRPHRRTDKNNGHGHSRNNRQAHDHLDATPAYIAPGTVQLRGGLAWSSRRLVVKLPRVSLLPFVSAWGRHWRRLATRRAVVWLGGRPVADVERNEGEATGLAGERSAAGGAAGCGGRGTPPRVAASVLRPAGVQRQNVAGLRAPVHACRRRCSVSDCAGCVTAAVTRARRGGRFAGVWACAFTGNRVGFCAGCWLQIRCRC